MSRDLIKCNSIKYRKGFIEVLGNIHIDCINLEVWNIHPDIDITDTDDLADDLISDKDVIANTEIELAIEKAELLVQQLSKAIKVVRREIKVKKTMIMDTVEEKTKNGFIVIEKCPLTRKPSVSDEENIILLSVVISYDDITDEHKPGTITVINEVLKSYFIKKYVIPFYKGKNNCEKQLGYFSTNNEFFDAYWILEPILCDNISIDIEYIK